MSADLEVLDRAIAHLREVASGQSPMAFVAREEAAELVAWFDFEAELSAHDAALAALQSETPPFAALAMIRTPTSAPLSPKRRRMADTLKRLSDDEVLDRFAAACCEFAIKRHEGRAHTAAGQIMRQYRDELRARLDRAARAPSHTPSP